jgi:hypothetical protein
VEEAEREEKLLVLDLGLAARELPLVDKLVKTLHIRLQTLRTNLICENGIIIASA